MRRLLDTQVFLWYLVDSRRLRPVSRDRISVAEEVSRERGLVARVATLPPHHADPLDRLLVAQAMHEPLHLLTADDALAPYSELVVRLP